MTTFTDLTSPQVAELLAGPRKPVLLLPVGAVEPHGPHAPLATDEIISAGMCTRAAQRLADDPDVRVLTLPTLSYGVTRFSAAFPGAVSISEATLHALVVDVCGSLTAQGLSRIVLVNNHFEPAHVATLRKATAEAGVAYLDLVRRRHAARLTEEFRSGACHAGQYETSLVLADHPALVDTATMAALPPVPVDMPAAMSDGKADFAAMGMDRAYCGAPAAATAEEGQSTFDVLTELLVEAIREVAR
ncbi:creatininase family protein [Actinophytocola oryzae]|uniref:Creatinine amidohydrolase n=1 Tax=Actinophytocola oryzae TaxID=502181 RepID=A0A4R7UQJ4_9PSEU|nr:creatininase family protein [Actinophytocola oryzae]TDV36669.1 creatinine amidohydrolase [Actinophytocola oryzae]